MKIDLLNINLCSGQIRQKTKAAEQSIYKKIIRQYNVRCDDACNLRNMFGFVFDYSKAPKMFDLFVFYLVILGTCKTSSAYSICFMKTRIR